MTKRMRALLLLVAIALAVSPLRGAFASPVIADAADDAAHCATMPHGAHSMDQRAAMPDSSPQAPDHHCKQGCGGHCCNGSCGTCVHACLAVPRNPAVGSDTFSDLPVNTAVYRYAARTIPPPFRPPIAIPG